MVKEARVTVDVDGTSTEFVFGRMRVTEFAKALDKSGAKLDTNTGDVRGSTEQQVNMLLECMARSLVSPVEYKDVAKLDELDSQVFGQLTEKFTEVTGVPNFMPVRSASPSKTESQPPTSAST